MFIPREEPFTCENCRAKVEPLGKGTYRDHCPRCLFSKHVDDRGPGDRQSECKGLLMPTGIDQDAKKGFLITYQCTRCKRTSRNRAAHDDDLVGFLRRNVKIV
jgi:DNA-directed RNA polymerase subunit RPC12/RpoP